MWITPFWGFKPTRSNTKKKQKEANKTITWGAGGKSVVQL